MKAFIPEETDWNLYFEPQQGGARFAGHPYQRGGNLLGLFRFAGRVVPLFANSPIGKEIINSTTDAVRAIHQGESPMSAIKTHGRKVIKNLTGLGPKRKSRIVKKKAIHKKKNSTRQSLFVPALPE